MTEAMKDILLEELCPFGIRDDEMMEKRVESICEYDVLVPAIVRHRKEG